MKYEKVKIENVSQMVLDMQENIKKKQIQVVHPNLFINLIIRYNLPYKFVEYPKLRSWINYLCANAIMVSKNTI